ncbi:MAG: isoprenylcysteine carboxylmethyltransferase family protein [Alphaproteobacteria bacterium]|nr:isoprenylcysteine carboxylmethyltransferase family protein [Alphaproteobacteria bacterium]
MKPLEPTPTPSPTPVLLRAWMATPDWIFRALGVCFFLIYALTRMQDYASSFPDVGPYWTPVEGDGALEYFPAAKILADLTFLLIILSFCFRTIPKQRAATAREIVIPVIAGFWPLFPFMALAALNIVSSPWAAPLHNTLEFGAISYPRFLLGVALLCLGNALDVWGYAFLFRSFSIVAEARALKTAGPYRFVRHPVYLGQLLAQAGIWLVLLNTHVALILFYIAFVAIQLYRAKIEDDVLSKAFGEDYLSWKRRTFWFTR